MFGHKRSPMIAGEQSVTLKIHRFNPESAFGERPYWQDYTITARPTDRVLDALQTIKDEQDGSLTFRRSCGHGICGSDAIAINGQNKLACQTLLRDVVRKRRPITIEPIRGLPVIRDLVVDMEPFYAKYRSVLPYLITPSVEPVETRGAPFDAHGFDGRAGELDQFNHRARENLQSPDEQARFSDTTKCILCAACTTSCPVYWSDGAYVGPAALVAAHRFIFDSRDHGGHERLALLDDREGVWRCRTAYNCTAACPRGIAVTSAIADIKRAELVSALE